MGCFKSISSVPSRTEKNLRLDVHFWAWVSTKLNGPGGAVIKTRFHNFWIQQYNSGQL